MRIAVIAPPWVPVPPPAYGGTERVLHELCCALAKQGHDVLLVTVGDSTCPVEKAWCYDRAVGVERAAPAAELNHVLHAYEVVSRWGADVVHDHTLTGPFIARDFPGVRVVTTNHGPFEGELGAVYARMAEHTPIIAISHHQASLAGDTPVAAVIHHGIDTTEFPIGSGRGDYAVFLGRMSPTKGVHTAIEVARRAGVPLRIAAKMREKDEHDYFDAQVAPRLGGDIEYLGEVGGREKLALLADARCLLNPIDWDEPFGMVMLEALACGTPVVATPRGAAPEIVDHGITGYLHADVDGLARALQAVGRLDRAECRVTAETRFSAKRMANDHLDVYAELVPVGALPDG